MQPKDPFPPESQIHICAICRQPVSLENAKTDNDGKAVHESCYARQMKSDGHNRQN